MAMLSLCRQRHGEHRGVSTRKRNSSRTWERFAGHLSANDPESLVRAAKGRRGKRCAEKTEIFFLFLFFDGQKQCFYEFKRFRTDRQPKPRNAPDTRVPFFACKFFFFTVRPIPIFIHIPSSPPASIRVNWKNPHTFCFRRLKKRQGITCLRRRTQCVPNTGFRI